MVLRRLIGIGLWACLMRGDGKVDLSGLANPDWHIRAKTLGQVLGDGELLQQGKAQIAVIECLEKEDDLLANGADVPKDEAYGDRYLSALEDTVFTIAKNIGSKEAEAALLKSAYNPDSEIGGLLASHYANSPALLSLTHSQSLGLRNSAIGVVGTMLYQSKGNKSKPLSDESYKLAKGAIITAAGDQREDSVVRQTAVRSLGEIGDQEDVAVL